MDKELATSCSVFAVWRWKWWAWIPATVLVFAVYVLSATPMWWLSFNLSSKIDSDVPYRVYSLTYWPANQCIRSSKILTEIHTWELKQMGVIKEDD